MFDTCSLVANTHQSIMFACIQFMISPHYHNHHNVILGTYHCLVQFSSKQVDAGMKLHITEDRMLLFTNSSSLILVMVLGVPADRRKHQSHYCAVHNADYRCCTQGKEYMSSLTCSVIDWLSQSQKSQPCVIAAANPIHYLMHSVDLSSHSTFMTTCPYLGFRV